MKQVYLHVGLEEIFHKTRRTLGRMKSFNVDVTMGLEGAVAIKHKVSEDVKRELRGLKVWNGQPYLPYISE